MGNNLFISYDLNSPGQTYDRVIDEIKTLGSWAKVQKSFWYVKSPLSASDALKRVWAKMDRTASWQGLSEEVAQHIKDNWMR